MSALFESGKKVEELEIAMARMTETITALESRIEGLEESIKLVREKNSNTRDRMEHLQQEVRDLQEKANISVLTSARKDVEARTDQAIEKARDAVNEYLKPLTS